MNSSTSSCSTFSSPQASPPSSPGSLGHHCALDCHHRIRKKLAALEQRDFHLSRETSPRCAPPKSPPAVYEDRDSRASDMVEHVAQALSEPREQPFFSGESKSTFSFPASHGRDRVQVCRPALDASAQEEIDQECLWDNKISAAIDKGERSIDLSNSNLNFIPPSISHLAHVTTFQSEPPQVTQAQKRVWTRTSTAPARMTDPNSRPRNFMRGKTSGHLNFDNEVHLYLYNNNIAALPPQLFKLANLVVLSLRGNNLTAIPAEIIELRRLKELNVANNQLTVLPPELDQMSLRSLILHPNPFQPTPKGDWKSRNLGVLHIIKSGIPSLIEYCLRSVARSDTPVPTEDIFPQRFPQRPSFLVQSDIDINAVYDAKTGYIASLVKFTCHNPQHSMQTACYSKHVVERLEWLDTIAGVAIAPRAPILWKGCSFSCLDFLETTSIPLTSEVGLDGEEFELSSDEDA